MRTGRRSYFCVCFCNLLDVRRTGGIGGLSAVCWLFGEYLQPHLNYPIGLVQTSRGGTSIEAWSPPEAISVCPSNPFNNEPWVQFSFVINREYSSFSWQTVSTSRQRRCNFLSFTESVAHRGLWCSGMPWFILFWIWPFLERYGIKVRQS